MADVGHHDAYSVPRGILPACARQLDGLPVLFVGLRCPLDVILQRRRATGYLASAPDETEAPLPVQRWQEAVHQPDSYDLELDTALLSPEACAEQIWQHLQADQPTTALQRRAAPNTSLLE